MKNIISIALLMMSILIFVPKPAAAAERKFLGFHEGDSGYGFNLGIPTTLRYQKWTSWKRAYSFDFGYAMNDKVIIGQANYAFYFYDAKDLWKSSSIFNSSLLYFGPGILSGIGLKGSDDRNDYQFGVRGFGGLEYVFSGSPWTMRAELAAVAYMKGRATIEFQGFIGVQYYMGYATDFNKKTTPSNAPIKKSSSKKEDDLSLD